MKNIKELKEMLFEFSSNNTDNYIVNIRTMFDLKLISYDEHAVLKEFILDNKFENTKQQSKTENLTIESAKQFLKDNGYFADNLWSVHDVQNNYNCTTEEAQEVLNDVLNSDRIKQEINETIEIVADAICLPKNSKYFSISGFWKEDKLKFSDYIVQEIEQEDYDENEDEKIFFYGLSESDIKHLIACKWETEYDFVITSYEETTLN